MKRVKIYMLVDKSGRGYTNQLNQTEIKKNLVGEKSWHGEAASTWALRADVGSVWENASLKITRIS